MSEPTGYTAEQVKQLVEALREAREYFENRADADQPPGSVPIPNEEMCLLVEIDEALKQFGDV